MLAVQTQNILSLAARGSGTRVSVARGSGTNAKFSSQAPRGSCKRGSVSNAKFSKSSRAW